MEFLFLELLARLDAGWVCNGLHGRTKWDLGKLLMRNTVYNGADIVVYRSKQGVCLIHRIKTLRFTLSLTMAKTVRDRAC